LHGPHFLLGHDAEKWEAGDIMLNFHSKPVSHPAEAKRNHSLGPKSIAAFGAYVVDDAA